MGIVSRLQVGAFLSLFFISGFSSLCYQLVWQRILFATFGINIESVTIIVSLFMFGLGVGALVGGKLQRYPQYLLCLFVCSELLIALFGFFSPSLITWLGSVKYIDSLWGIAISAYIIFALPTLLMGATLPILVGYIDRFVGHTGRSVGWLYASNTLGAAVASYAVVTFFFAGWGLGATIDMAVCLNLFTAVLALFLYKKFNGDVTCNVYSSSEFSVDVSLVKHSQWLILAVGFALGYLSLSQELVWYRVLGFLTANKPQIFGLLLASFLAGVALSSVVASNICTASKNVLLHVFFALLAMSLIWYIALPIVSYATAYYGKEIGFYVALSLAGVTAFFSGGVFPILCHALQVKTRSSAGSAVGGLYFANVMGSTLGPLITGFVIFEYFSLQAAVLWIGVISALAMLIWITAIPMQRTFYVSAKGAILATTLFGYVMYANAYEGFLETLHFARPSPAPYSFLNTNRSGIISMSGNTVFGNGVYDGMMNIHPGRGRNRIDRAYAVVTMHPNPKRILTIGLSGGSWAKAISLYQPLEKLVIVEINKGYLEILKRYKDHADLLNNPKVDIVIDDGRRWLKNHPEERFDMIVMNTIYHWRSNATNLLSAEFMELCKRHLNDGGYIYVNTTGAPEVAYTAAYVFKYVAYAPTRMVLAGDVPSEVDMQTRITNLEQFYYPDGREVFGKQYLIDDIVGRSYPDQRDNILNHHELSVITDDNMVTEFGK